MLEDIRKAAIAPEPVRAAVRGYARDAGFGRESPRWMIEDFSTVRTLLPRGTSLWGERR